MYSEDLPEIIRAVAAIGHGVPIGPPAMRSLLEKRMGGQALDLGEITALLNGLSDPANRDLVRELSRNFRRPHDREVFLLTPLYFSSVCENGCAYCDFSADGGRLTIGEFRDELDELMNLGYRSLELVSSQDPELYRKRPPFDLSRQEFDVSPVAEYFRVARERQEEHGGGLLISNIPPLDVESFRKLKDAGLDTYLSWMECFDSVSYARFHRPETPKGDQSFRLDAFERALEAGIPFLAGAFLKGLADWRREEAALYLFDRRLRESRGSGFSIIGTPRLKGAFARTEGVGAHAVSDDDFELNLALDRILFDGTLWLQTREHPDFNLSFLRRYGGGVLLTVDCSTAPGGYRRPSRNRPQFPVHRRNIRNAVQTLEEAGFRVRFDWDGGLLRDFERAR